MKLWTLLLNISIHALTGSATLLLVRGLIVRFLISIHALTGSATYTVADIPAELFISIHALTGSATFDRLCTEQSKPISIHALTGSATPSLSAGKAEDQAFQSTHSRGVRLFYRALKSH